jgi:hypothetical protein
MGVRGYTYSIDLPAFLGTWWDSIRAIYHSSRAKLHSTSYSKSNRALSNFTKQEDQID